MNHILQRDQRLSIWLIANMVNTNKEKREKKSAWLIKHDQIVYRNGSENLIQKIEDNKENIWTDITKRLTGELDLLSRWKYTYWFDANSTDI